MLRYIQKDITTVENGLIIQGVNIQGVMGGGIALAIRRKWPKVYTRYLKYINDGFGIVGESHLVIINPNLVVANIFTQEFYGNDGKQYADHDAIRFNLEIFGEVASIEKKDIYSPKIGCGLGGLNWDEVKQTYEKVADKYPDIDIFVCDIAPP